MNLEIIKWLKYFYKFVIINKVILFISEVNNKEILINKIEDWVSVLI